MKMNKGLETPRTYEPRAVSVPEAAALLESAGIVDAAVIGPVTAPDVVIVTDPIEDMRTLRSLADRKGSIISDGTNAAAVSKLIASVREKAAKAAARSEAKQAKEPAPAEVTEALFSAPAAEEAEVPAVSFERPAFILLLDDLASVPSLADLPGAQPDIIVALPQLAEQSEEQVREALMRVVAVSIDTLCAKTPVPGIAGMVSGAHQQAAEALQSGECTPLTAAELLLARGMDSGMLYSIGHAVAARCGMKPGKAMVCAAPAVAPALGCDLAGSDVTPVDELRLCDIPPIAAEVEKKAYPTRIPLKRNSIAKLLHRLYALRSEPTPVEDLIALQEKFFRSGRTLPVEFRKRQLKLLLDWVDTHEAEIESALLEDLGKCAFEAFETEIMLVRDEIKTMLRYLPLWQAGRFGIAPIVHFPATTRRVRNPHGRVLVMSPWNYPFLLTMDPLVGAIAGGNCVVVKPSAYAPATSRLIAEMAHDLFDPDFVAVVEGGREQNQSLLRHKFDHIFFTGSVSVGKLVMQSAAEHLTPVTLELGGKSPCIVDETADIPLAARRIAWGKFINAGQTCVAPDYVLIHPSVADEFIMEVEKNVRQLYGSEPLDNGELCRIVNERHFDRLNGLIEGMDVAVGGASDRTMLKIEPTVLRNVSFDDAVMQEEIFGPILPVVAWDGDFDGVIDQIESRPRPLAAYLFTSSKENKRKFLSRLRFGGGCINDVLCHLASKLPFGGVGESGMGAYHGRYSFNTFTHEKGVLCKSNRLDIKVRYAPYVGKLQLLRRLSR